MQEAEVQQNSFQRELNLLLKAKNIVDRVNAFTDLLKTVTSQQNVFPVYKSAAESDWTDFDTAIKFSMNLSIAGVTIIHNNENYKNNNITESILIALSDGSFIGILFEYGLNNGTSADIIKIAVQLLIQVFETQSYSYLSQKKEKELIFNLNEKIVQLNSLIDTGIELSRFEKRDILFELALERICSLTNASSALMKITNADNKLLNKVVFPPGSNTELIEQNIYRIESSFVFHNLKYNFTLSEKETRTGGTYFSDLDKMLLEAVCKQVNVVIENEFLQQEMLLKQRYEQEISVAASIQQRIIPDKLPVINGFEISGINIPSREVGGDYYDCIDLGKGKYAFIIADVSGKGIAAALLVNTLNAALYSYLEFDFPLNEMVNKLNKLIYNSSPVDKFITFFIAVLEISTGKMNIVNAGHNPILLLRKDSSLEMINAGGVGLGMFNLGIPYIEQTLNLNSGDKLFLYTDGIPEAMNVYQEEYSDERMINFLKNHSDHTAYDFISKLVDDVKKHSGTAEQSDDITALYLKRK